ncbi:MAG: SIMPL domain-containing protein [Planctomycetota bacterium]
MLLRKKAVAAMAALLAVSLVRGASAGDPVAPNRVSVTARGQAPCQADTIEIEFTVTAHTEEAGEAEKKFHDKLARVQKALKEGEGTAPRKKGSSDDDDEDAPKPKKKTPAKATPAPAKPKKKPVDEDDEEDDEPAPKKKTDPKKDEKKDESKKDEPKKDEPKKDEPKKDEPKKDEPKKDAIPVEIFERALSISVKSSKSDDTAVAKMMAGRMGVQPEKNDSPMYFSTKVVALIKDVKNIERRNLCKRIAQLIDLGIDAGADGSDGDAPVVRFLLKDHESFRKAAYKDAMEKAKRRGGEIAELSDRKLAGVLSVTEAPVPTSQPKADDTVQQGEKIVAMIYGVRVKDGNVLLPSMDVQAEVELRVEFELK